VGTDASIMASAAAQWAFVHGRGKPGVIIFTDSTNPIASAKADLIQAQIENLGATVLETVDIPLDDAPTQVRAQTPLLLDKYAKQWTYSIAVNDRYFDTIGYALAAAGIKGSGFPQSVGAGGGVPSAYQRIRAGLYQAATVAKPLNLQGWQLVDELNRALNGEAPSGYQTAVHLVTTDNIRSDGGDLDQFDPDNGYRERHCHTVVMLLIKATAQLSNVLCNINFALNNAIIRFDLIDWQCNERYPYSVEYNIGTAQSRR